MSTRKGACLCGAVKYELKAEPIASRICWCEDCQRIAANGTVNMLTASDALEIKGELSEYNRTAASGNVVSRRFCPCCGCHLFANSSARPEFTVVRAGTLENPSSIKPTMNIWTTSAPSWASFDPALECIEQQPAPPPQKK